MQNPTEYSNAIGMTVVKYITAVCGAAVTDLKLCLTAYHTKFEHNHNGIERYNVIKYPLPANGFLMVIQQHQNNLFEVASGFTPTNTKYVFYCIGDITSKMIPYFHNDVEEDLTTFVLFNHIWENDSSWELVDVRGELDAILDDHEHESIQKGRIVEHFEDICKLCVKYSPPDVTRNRDGPRNRDGVQPSMNLETRLQKVHSMFSDQALSRFGRTVLRKGVKARLKKLLKCDSRQ